MKLREYVGKKINLIVRQINGTNSIYSNATLIDVDEHSITIMYRDKRVRVEPRLYCAVEVLEK